MAKKNARDGTPTENPQMSDIVLILDKKELQIQAVSEISEDGSYSAVPADQEHKNSFLKIDRSSNLFENFVKNFWSQIKDPTRFGLYSIIEKELDSIKIKQAIEDIIAGKKTDAAEDFLKKHEIASANNEKQNITVSI